VVHGTPRARLTLFRRAVAYGSVTGDAAPAEGRPRDVNLWTESTDGPSLTVAAFLRAQGEASHTFGVPGHSAGNYQPSVREDATV
jgi:hypothetical protein